MLRSYHCSFRALGTECQFVIVSSIAAAQTEAIMQNLMSSVVEFEQRFSRFIATSELTYCNARAGLRTPVSAQFHDIILAAKTAALQSGGIYNPFILPALQRSGYRHSWSGPNATDDPVTDYTTRAIATIDKLEIGDNWVRIPHNTALDLGGCGKGYIGDKLAETLDITTGIDGYWLSVGGDVIARGTHQSHQPIVISIPYAHAPQHSAASVTVPRHERIAVATSTTRRRRGHYKGKSWHHIIDPATGMPAHTAIHTASVCHTSLCTADVQASNCIIVGRDGIEDFMASQLLSDVLIQYTTPEQADTIRHFGRRIV